MTDSTISPLRRRMVDDMTIRGFASKTQNGYIRAVKDFAAFLGRSPDQASAEDLRRYQLHMRSAGAPATSMNAAVSGLRFFFGVTLRRDDAAVGMTGVREPHKLPVVLSPEEVARLLDAATSLKYKAALSVAYGTGLRASEVVSLKLTDINSEREVIRVEQGKGRKDRYAVLPAPLLNLLRAWWRAGREHGVMLPGGWLFPGQKPVNPLTTRQLGRAFHDARKAAGIPRVKPEGRLARVVAYAAALLRHPPSRGPGRHSSDPEPAPAKAGVLMGHNKLETTARYSQVASTTLRAVKSPLERLAGKVKPPN